MSFYGFNHGAWGVSHQALWAGATVAAVGGGALITGETDGLGIDFAYHTDRTLQMSVLDTVTLTNAGNFDPYSKLTYTSPAIKLCRQSDGVWRYGSHNLYLNSASPANQSVTVVSGGTYSVVITGSVSITVSGAATGTYTSGTNNFTAATTTLTCGSTSGTGTVAVFRTPCVGTYLATTGSIVIDLPYEWNAAGASLGILIEEARTNLHIRSQEFDNAAWTTAACSVTADNTTAPDGTSTADLVTGSGSSQSLNTTSDITISASTNYAMSCFVKKGNFQWVRMTPIDSGGSNGYRCWFDLNSGVVGSSAVAGSGFSIVSTSITDAGNGWYRIVAVFNTTGTVVKMAITSASADASTTRADVGSGAGVGTTLYQWGAQVELGSFATSPIHTIGATVTRAVDTISFPTTGFNHSATKGTLYANFNPINVGAIRYALAFDDDTANEHFSVGCSAAAAGRFSVIDGGVAQTAPLTNGTVTAGSSNKIAASWQANDFAVSTAGTAVSTDVSGSLPTVTKLKFGVGATSTNPLNGYLQQIVHLPRDMTDGELVTKTASGAAGQAIGLLLTLTYAS